MDSLVYSDHPRLDAQSLSLHTVIAGKHLANLALIGEVRLRQPENLENPRRLFGRYGLGPLSIREAARLVATPELLWQVLSANAGHCSKRCAGAWQPAAQRIKSRIGSAPIAKKSIACRTLAYMPFEAFPTDTARDLASG
jgi:hypothetical protein